MNGLLGAGTRCWLLVTCCWFLVACCWFLVTGFLVFAAFNEKRVKEILGIPEGIRVVGLMPIGYPVDLSLKEKTRLQFEKIVRYEHW